MKKNIMAAFAAAAAALTILLSLSCTKQEDIQSVSEAKIFTGSIEQVQTKTVLVDDVKVNWSEGDEVCIISTSDGNVGIYSATPKANGTAEFTFVKGDEPQKPGYSAVYPATLFQGEGLYFPRIQKYESGKLNTPMVAFSQTEELKFKNICGVVCFALTGSVEIGSIELLADGVALCGETEVRLETAKATAIGTPSDENNRVILRCGDKKNGVKLDSDRPTYFYIYLPETTIPAGKLQAEIYGVNGGCNKLKTHRDVTVEANNIYTFEFTIDSFDSEEDAPATAVEHIDIYQTTILPGEFTVDANGTKVKFTSGNLVWTSKCGWECDMAPEGRIIEPFENENDSVNLFLWHDIAEKSLLGHHENTPSTPYLFCDGHTALFNDGENDLHVLSKDQWNYILFSRSNASRFAKARYNGMPGLLLFPDNFVWTTQIAEFLEKSGVGNTIDKQDVEFPATSLSDDEFTILEKHGYVFLPAEAVRGYKDSKVKVDGGLGDTANGHYWGIYDGGYAMLEFDNNKVKVNGGVPPTDQDREDFYNISYGCSIRLVQVIPAAQEVEQTARY